MKQSHVQIEGSGTRKADLLEVGRSFLTYSPSFSTVHGGGGLLALELVLDRCSHVSETVPCKDDCYILLVKQIY